MEHKTGPGPALPGPPLTGEAVAAYLREHPDFLIAHPEVARFLTPPSHADGDGVADFTRFLIDRLRAEIAALKARESGLISRVESNVSGQGRVHRACLKLLDARSADEFARIVRVDLLAILDVSAARLCVADEVAAALFGAREDIMVLDGNGRDLKPGRDAVLRRAKAADKALFAGSEDEVESVALMRLVIGRDMPSGLLALASQSAQGFQPTQATDLLVFLARVAETRLRQWLMPTP